MLVDIHKVGRMMGGNIQFIQKSHLNLCCFLQKNVHSTKFVTYFCEHVLPNLSALTTPVEGLDIQLEVRQSYSVFEILRNMHLYCWKPSYTRKIMFAVLRHD